MKKIDDDILADYIFNLLDKKEAKWVEKEISQSIELQTRLGKLTAHFKQLNLIEEKKSPRSIIYFVSSIAALLLISLFVKNSLKTNPMIHTASMKMETKELGNGIFEVMKLESYSRELDHSSLMNIPEAPIAEKKTFTLREACLEIALKEENRNDLNSYLTSILSNQESTPVNQSLEYYCTLKLTN